MTSRTTKRTVTFARPFWLGEPDLEFPAGQYVIETDESPADAESFPFYRRAATMTRLVADPRHPCPTETAAIDPLQLEAALEMDAAEVLDAEPDIDQSTSADDVKPVAS